MYEINPIYARYARKFIKNAVVVNADSVQAVRNGKLRRNDYTFVVIDNLFGCFGKYCKHFDLFPNVLRYIKDGVLALNFFNMKYRNILV